MKKSKLLAMLLAISLLVFAACSNPATGGNDSKETTQDTPSETVVETPEETQTETVKETTEANHGNDKTDINGLDLTKSSLPELDNKITKELQEDLKKYSVTLVSAFDTTFDTFPEENLQAIAKYENDESFGYVVRYAANRAALIQYFKESTTGVFVMYDAKMNLELSEEPIKNDSAAEFKEVAEKLIQKYIAGEAKIEYGY